MRLFTLKCHKLNHGVDDLERFEHLSYADDFSFKKLNHVVKKYI